MSERVPIDEMSAALELCGANRAMLAPGEQEALDRKGYVVLADVVDADWLARLRSAFEAAVAREQLAPNTSSTGTRHANDLAFADPVFDGIYTHPKVLALVAHVLQRPFRVLVFGGRDPLPGFGQQGLHTDWMPRVPPEPFSVVTAIWLLDDFTRDNGATRLIPGSHLVPRALSKAMQTPASRHPDQQLVIAKAGSVLVLNGHLWHSATRNDSQRPRRILQCQFVARDRVPPIGTRSDLPQRLSRAACYLLGY